MKRKYPENLFERYADDIVMHCDTDEEVNKLKETIKERLLECKLELHPEKNKIVYCKDLNRTGSSEHEKFDFLGYTFRTRSSRNRQGKLFVNFSPAISDKAKKKKREDAQEWIKAVKPTSSFGKLVQIINPAVSRIMANSMPQNYREQCTMLKL